MSTHFKEDIEFACHCGCGESKVSPRLILLLEAMRVKLDAPIHILSGRRCYTHNLKCGGKPKSQHLLGNAADITTPKMSPKELQHWLFIHFNKECKGIGSYAGFTHIDCRPNEYARWKG